MMSRRGRVTSPTEVGEYGMYIRIVRSQVQPGQVDELARRWQTFWGSRMPNIPGFRHAHFAADPATNPTAAVSLWEQRPDAATMEPLMRGFRTQVADLSGSWPVIEEYEILADF
jgi:hypothetical protein